MRQRRIITFLLAFVLVAAVASLWSAESTQRDGDEEANIVAANSAETGESQEPTRRRGNRFARALSAPFRAIGRAFGGGRDEGRMQRTTERDRERFESVAVARANDSRSVPHTRPDATASAEEHLAAGRALLNQGRVNEAIAALSLAASLAPRSAPAHNLLAVAYDRRGLRDRARESYERSLRIEPHDAQTLNNLGYSLYTSGHYRAAIERLQRAARLAPNDQRILNNLALAQCRVGKYDEALQNFTRAGGAFNGRMNLAAILERIGRDQDAIEHYEAAQRLQPDSIAARRRLADLYRRAGSYELTPTAQAAARGTE